MLAWRRVRRPVVCLVVVAGCWTEQRVDDTFTEAEWDYLQTFRLDRLAPITCADARCEAIAGFGQQLFFDRRYAGPIRVASELGAAGETGKIACALCHDPTHGFSDGRADNAVSLGTAWTGRNVPALVDLAYREAFTWGGKYTTIDAVLELAITSKAAMNVTENPLGAELPKEQRLAALVTTTYAAIYEPLFGRADPGIDDAAVYANAALAIATYERQLVSGPSPFDRYLAGDPDAIDAAAKRGARLFIGKALCSECHAGPLFTDDRFHVTGVAQRGAHAPAIDRGRFEVTGDPRDDGRFRTPTLRHVARTAPYMHAGQLATLADVIELYRWGGDPGGFAGTKDPRLVPLELVDDDVRDLEAFLLTLTGAPVDARWTTPPVLP